MGLQESGGGGEQGPLAPFSGLRGSLTPNRKPVAFGREDSEEGGLSQGNIEQKRRENRVCRVCPLGARPDPWVTVWWSISGWCTGLTVTYRLGGPQGSDFAFLCPSVFLCPCGGGGGGDPNASFAGLQGGGKGAMMRSAWNRSWPAGNGPCWLRGRW